MFPPDLTAILASVGIILAIALFYGFFLVKLKPSTDVTSTSSEKETEKKEKMEILHRQVPTKSHHSERTQENNNELGTIDKDLPEGVPVKENVKGPQKNSRSKDSRKSFFLFGENDFEQCKHKFGHLVSLPKNTPLPEECFGCPQILDCLNLRKKPS